jgi:hypothetical protein
VGTSEFPLPFSQTREIKNAYPKSIVPTPSSFAFKKGVGFLIAEVGSYTSN